LWTTAIVGELPVPLDFSATTIPTLRWTADAGEIFVMMLPLLSTGIFLVARLFFPKKLPFSQKVKIEEAGKDVNNRLVSLSMWTCLFCTLTLYFASGLSGGGHWYETKEAFFSEYGLGAVLLGYSLFALRVIFLASAVHEFMRGSITTTRLFTIVGLVCVTDLYTTGNRIFTLQAAVLVASAMVARRDYRRLAICAIFAIPFGAFMGAFRWIRAGMHVITGSGFSGLVGGISNGMDIAANQISQNGFGFLEFISGATESVNLNVYYGMLVSFPKDINFLLGSSYAKILVFAIPRSIWPGKPESIALIAGKLFAPGSGGALITTFFGELYANFGLLFVVMAPLLLCACRGLVRIFLRGSYLFPMVAFSMGFVLVRMPLTDILISCLLIGIYTTVFQSILKVRLQYSTRAR